MTRVPLREGDPRRVGRYRLAARLGTGGMGVVYLGVARNGTQVAVKVLRPELADDPEFRARFRREVAMLTRVNGLCTVQVIEADTDSSRPFLVTEYAAGPSLAEYIEAHGPLDADMLHGLAAGLAEALSGIHATGVVHRDFKPSNVILAGSGPKVIDFGIAQALDSTAVTRTGMTVGSAGFMAPEQIMGRAGPPADIFAWAVTVGYAASGQPPFGTGASDAILYRILHAEPDISAVPEPLRPLVRAALAKDPRQRPAASELLDSLTSASASADTRYGTPTQTLLSRTWHPVTHGTVISPARRRRVLPAAVLSLALLAVSAVIAVAATRHPAVVHLVGAGHSDAARTEVPATSSPVYSSAPATSSAPVYTSAPATSSAPVYTSAPASSSAEIPAPTPSPAATASFSCRLSFYYPGTGANDPAGWVSDDAALNDFEWSITAFDNSRHQGAEITYFPVLGYSAQPLTKHPVVVTVTFTNAARETIYQITGNPQWQSSNPALGLDPNTGYMDVGHSAVGATQCSASQ